MRHWRILTSAMLLISCQGKENYDIRKSGAYFGESFPQNIPQIFGPGVISTGLYERDFTISPDGSEIYYTIMGVNYSVIVVTKKENGFWSELEVAPFSGSTKYFDAEPHISPDGKKLLFLSTRPQEGQEPKPGWAYQDIWAMDRMDTAWGKPYNLGQPVNTDLGEYFPSVTKTGTLYFTRAEADEQHQAIYSSEFINGSYSEPVKLSEKVNNTGFEYNACISPSEKYIIVCNQPKEGKIGISDYSVSFRNEDGTWGDLINLGNPINQESTRAISPYLTPDEKFLVFSSNLQVPLGDTINHTISMDQLRNSRTKYQNGNSDIYWVSTSIIENLKIN